MLYKYLIELGFSHHESLILEVLFQFSPSGATYLAKKTKLARSSVYTSINGLIEKGIIGVTYKNEVKQFIISDFGSLERILLEQKNKIENKINLIPKVEDLINKIQYTSLQVPTIINYEGQEGLKKIYLDMLRSAPTNSILYIMRNEFIWDPTWNFAHEKEWNSLSKKLKEKKNIETHLIVNDSKIEREKKDFYDSRKFFKYKYINSKYNFKDFSLYILGDTISMISVENNNLVGVKIVNQNFADNYKGIFSEIWEKN